MKRGITMKVEFKCNNCSTTFVIEENELYGLEKLSCPGCNSKITKKLLNQLSDQIIELNSCGNFDVKLYASNKISYSDLDRKILTNGLTFNMSKFKDVNNYKDLLPLLKSEEELPVILNLIRGAIIAYHDSLNQNLKQIGINIGEIL
jgi:DNA-directed RNA polymerase subunit RPC12/RpoP